MHLMILALFLAIMAHDEVPGLVAPLQRMPLLLMWVVAAKLGFAALYALLCRRTAGRLGDNGAGKRLKRLEQAGSVFRAGVFVLFLIDLHWGLLVYLRQWIEAATGIRHPILIDELLTMLPTLALWGLGWAAYYPVERRLREAALIRQLDQGLPVFAIWSRRQYVLAQYRYQVLLILLPLLAVIAWTECVDRLALSESFGITQTYAPLWTAGGCLGIFLTAPLIIRLAWDTIPMPEGDIRDHLLSMCKTYRVRVRELLLWRTYGGMINAAVMGFVGPLRYILITDGLLQQMPMHHVEAVMAHELAHVRKKHMFWLLLSAAALVMAMSEMVLYFLSNTGSYFIVTDGQQVFNLTMRDNLQLLVILGVGVFGWSMGFGWVSRRAERQADAFAVAHLARERGDEIISATDTQTMIDALQHVADLNHVRANKHNWRHGSIRWRQDYLRGLAGVSVDRIGVDRLMRWVNGVSLAVATGLVMLQVWG